MEEKITLQAFATDLLSFIDNGALELPVGYLGPGVKKAYGTCDQTIVYLLSMIDAVLAIHATSAEVPRPDYWFFLLIANEYHDSDNAVVDSFPIALKRMQTCSSVPCENEDCRKMYKKNYLEAITTQKVRLFTEYTGSSMCIALFILKNMYFNDATEEEILNRVLRTDFYGVNSDLTRLFERCLKCLLRNVELITGPADLIVDKERKLLGLSFRYDNVLLGVLDRYKLQHVCDLPTAKEIQTPTHKNKSDIRVRGELADVRAPDNRQINKKRPMDSIGSNAITKFQALFAADREASAWGIQRHKYVQQKWYLSYNFKS
jgi:hypothetical protein